MDVHRAHLLVFEQIKEADITNLQVIVLDKPFPSMYKAPAAAGLSIKPHFPPLAIHLQNDFLLPLWQVLIRISSHEFLSQIGNKIKAYPGSSNPPGQFFFFEKYGYAIKNGKLFKVIDHMTH
jgi:hypothetical protein